VDGVADSCGPASHRANCYDTPATISGKMSYAEGQGPAGAFFRELPGDTSNGELITAMKSGPG